MIYIYSRWEYGFLNVVIYSRNVIIEPRNVVINLGNVVKGVLLPVMAHFPPHELDNYIVSGFFPAIFSRFTSQAARA